MAIPAKAFVFPQTMDPKDLIEYQADLDGIDGLLETGELIDTYELTLLPESVALGLTIINEVRGSDDYTMDTPNGVAIRFFVEVDELLWEDPAFLGDGVLMPMELTVWTTSTPPRRRQRTLVIGAYQQ